MKVLVVDHTAGVAPFRRKFASLAAQAGIDLTVIAPERWIETYQEVPVRAGWQDGYEVLTGRVVWPGYENRAFFVSGLGQSIRRVRPDILHLWEEPFSFIAFQSLLFAARFCPRAPVLFSTSDDLSHGFRYPYRPSRLYEAIERRTLRRARAATVMNEKVRALLREKGFQGPLELITHGVDLEAYPSSLASRDARAPGGKLAIGYLGRLTHQKGVDVLIRAAGLLTTRLGPDAFTLEIVGEGPEKRRLEALAAEQFPRASVAFRAAVAHAEVPQVMSRFDVLVLPSRTLPTSQEHFGRVLIEGMAAGCVVIGTDSGAIPEVLADAGLVVPESDPDALAAAIEGIADSPPAASALRARGRARVEERYTWDAIASRLAAFYRAILAGAPNGEEYPRPTA